MTLVLAISYGARQELACAAGGSPGPFNAGELALEDIDEAAIGRSLLTAGIPDPDILIRTSGEQRISNFLLWQLAYTELVFVDRLWPDFGAADLADAIAEFHRRDRRYGATDSSSVPSNLALRMRSAAMLLPVAFLAIWAGGVWFSLFVAAALVAMAWEWADLCAPGQIAVVAATAVLGDRDPRNRLFRPLLAGGRPGRAGRDRRRRRRFANRPLPTARSPGSG